MRVDTQDARDLEAVAYLRTPEAVRKRCEQIFAAGVDGRLAHFRIDLTRLPHVAERIVTVTRQSYPLLDIPPHSRMGHFNAGGVDRLRTTLPPAPDDPDEYARRLIDLTVTSVLLDAGAGEAWRYRDTATNTVLSRSEGLAVASLNIFAQGMFSADANDPCRADASRLAQLNEDELGAGFQVSSSNPLVGLSGRTTLLRRLGEVVATTPEYFGVDRPRVGGLLDHFRQRAKENRILATDVLATVLTSLGPIWPGRLTLAGVNLGDVGRHPAAAGEGASTGLVPFHKLSQWLTYSLFAPLATAGMTIVGSDGLTGLAEYRNGGLFVDLGVLSPRQPAVYDEAHAPYSEIIVEWRALTVALLDRVANLIRSQLKLSASDLSLAQVLEGGTWRAGREVAAERRSDARPPIRVASDGTVF